MLSASEVKHYMVQWNTEPEIEKQAANMSRDAKNGFWGFRPEPVQLQKKTILDLGRIGIVQSVAKTKALISCAAHMQVID